MSDKTLTSTYIKMLAKISRAGDKYGEYLRRLVTVKEAEAMRNYINKQQIKAN
jgi:hypothetical protein